MGFIKKVKFIDSATGMEVGKDSGISHPPTITAKAKYRNRIVYCRRGHKVKMKGMNKGNDIELHFFCKVCGILKESEVTTLG